MSLSAFSDPYPCRPVVKQVSVTDRYSTVAGRSGRAAGGHPQPRRAAPPHLPHAEGRGPEPPPSRGWGQGERGGGGRRRKVSLAALIHRVPHLPHAEGQGLGGGVAPICTCCLNPPYRSVVWSGLLCRGLRHGGFRQYVPSCVVCAARVEEPNSETDVSVALPVPPPRSTRPCHVAGRRRRRGPSTSSVTPSPSRSVGLSGPRRCLSGFPLP